MQAVWKCPTCERETAFTGKKNWSSRRGGWQLDDLCLFADMSRLNFWLQDSKIKQKQPCFTTQVWRLPQCNRPGEKVLDNMRLEGHQWLTNRILCHIALSTCKAQDSQLHAAQSSEMLHKPALGRTIRASQMPFLESACSSLYILEYCDRGPRGKFIQSATRQPCSSMLSEQTCRQYVSFRRKTRESRWAQLSRQRHSNIHWSNLFSSILEGL